MAIFTNRHDQEHVSILVQMAQIDTSDPDELRHIYNALTDSDGMHGMGTNIDSPEGAAVLIELCDVVRRTFRAIAKDRSIPADCLIWINRKQRAKTYKQFTLDNGESLEDALASEGDKLIPMNALDVEYWGEQNYDVVERVIEPLHLWVSTFISDNRLGETHDSLRSCIECDNPFMPFDQVNKKQVYCSRRCANRAGQRRRYQPVKPKF